MHRSTGDAVIRFQGTASRRLLRVSDEAALRLPGIVPVVGKIITADAIFCRTDVGTPAKQGPVPVDPVGCSPTS
jgi:hypothetical protein